MSVFLEQVISALQFLEEMELVHQDVKPDNILIDEDGLLKLCDNDNCADLIRRESNATNNDNSSSECNRSPVRGTLAYLALHCESGTTDRNKYSMGVVAYVTGEGVHPFDDLIQAQLVDLIPTKFRNWKPEFQSKMSNDLQKVIRRL